MPELPEVETIVRQLRSTGVEGRCIVCATVSWPKTAENFVAEQLVGRVIKEVRRRGKFLLFQLSEGYLIGHLRMSGRLGWLEQAEASYERWRLEFDDGRVLCFEDPRKFGRWGLYDRPDERLGGLGMEPLEALFTADYLKELLQCSRRQLKPFLLDQSKIAGLGNIYVDEALWLSRLHPLRLTADLQSDETVCLRDAIVAVLEIGIARKGTSLGQGQGNYYNLDGKLGGMQECLQVYRRTGKSCFRCKAVIERIVVAQRGTHFCPRCQLV